MVPAFPKKDSMVFELSRVFTRLQSSFSAIHLLSRSSASTVTSWKLFKKPYLRIPPNNSEQYSSSPARFNTTDPQGSFFIM